MSDVLRFWSHDACNIMCVREFDYDNLKSKFLECQSELAALKHPMNSAQMLRNELAALREELATSQLNLSIEQAKLSQVRASLTGAEQRNAILETELRNIRQSCELSKLRDARIEAMLTKPTESGASE